jgi:hypothetical protein
MQGLFYFEGDTSTPSKYSQKEAKVDALRCSAW